MPILHGQIIGICQKTQLLISERIAQMSFVRPVNMDDTLNLMYKTLSPGMEKKLENFNGHRKISVYRGDTYMNKITRKISDPPMLFIRNLQNIGTKENPQMATKVLAFKVPKGDILVTFEEAGNSLKGVFLEIYREGFVAYKRIYQSLADVRKDGYFLSSVSAMAKKDFIPPHLQNPNRHLLDI